MKYVAAQDDSLPVVELTRRNLMSLLAKLNGSPPNSVCTLIDPDHQIAVRAVEDAMHYEAEGRAPGLMHEDTEARLTENTGADFDAP